MSQPWDKLPRETQKSFDAFSRYLAMGPHRSLRKLEAAMSGLQKLDRSRPWRLEKWSRRNDWVDRATAWDKANAERSIARAEASRDDALDKLSSLAGIALNVLAEVLRDQGAPVASRVACAREVLDRLDVRIPARADREHGISILLPSPEELAEQVAERSAGGR